MYIGEEINMSHSYVWSNYVSKPNILGFQQSVLFFIFIFITSSPQ